MNVNIKNYYLPIILIVVNIFSKSLFLTTQSICIDEPFTIYHAQFDVVNIIHYLKNYNNPPLYEILLHFWIKIFGISITSVRVLPMLFSSLTVFFIYQIGTKFFDKRIAIISSTLYTLSSYNIWYAHDCRTYPLFVLLTTISFYLFFKLLKENYTWLNVFLFSFTNLLLVYCHYFSFFVLLVEFLIICFFNLRSPSVLKRYIIAGLLTLVGYIPQIIILWQRAETASNGTWVESPNGLESIYNVLWYFCNEPIPTVVCILLLVIGLMKFIFFKEKKSINPFSIYISMWFIIPFFLMFFISYKIPMFIERYVLFTSPAFYFLLSLSVDFLFKSKKYCIAANIILVGVFFFSATLNPSKKREVEDTINWIKSKKDKNTAVLVCGPDFMLNFAYYYDINYFKLKTQNSEYSELERSFREDNIFFINRLDYMLLDKINTCDKVIYLDAEANFNSPDNKIKETLFEKLKFTERVFFYNKFNIYNFRVARN